jgi:2-methylisocitrate lyase-like PEP mutase family enzyme
MFEGDNETPWLTPMELYKLGFSMILYPTSILFRVVRTIEQGLADLRQRKKMERADGIDVNEWEQIVNVPYWATPILAVLVPMLGPPPVSTKLFVRRRLRSW